MAINLGPTKPLNPANQSGSLSMQPGAQGTAPKMNFNKTPAQNIQGRMTFKPPPQQNNFQRGSLGNSGANIGGGQNNQYGNPAPYLNPMRTFSGSVGAGGGSLSSMNPSMNMGMMGPLSGPAPQMGQMPFNPALGINPPALGGGMEGGIKPIPDGPMGGYNPPPMYNDPLPGLNGGMQQPPLSDANTGMGGLPSFTQFQEPTGAPPAPPLGNPMVSGIGPTNPQNLMGRIRRF